MSLFKVYTCAFLVAAVSLSMVGVATAQDSCATPRQYYSEWKKHPRQAYHYRNYYYKPRADYSGYKHHYVVYTPKKPKHLYYYNPYEKKYWGRCSINHGGKPRYSHLKPEHRGANLVEIPEANFPEFGSLPPIPESNDGQFLDLPPDDLPIIVEGDF